MDAQGRQAEGGQRARGRHDRVHLRGARGSQRRQARALGTGGRGETAPVRVAGEAGVEQHAEYDAVLRPRQDRMLGRELGHLGGRARRRRDMRRGLPEDEAREGWQGGHALPRLRRGGRGRGGQAGHVRLLPPRGSRTPREHARGRLRLLPGGGEHVHHVPVPPHVGSPGAGGRGGRAHAVVTGQVERGHALLHGALGRPHHVR